MKKWRTNDDINDYIPSLLCPRSIRKNNFNSSLTQNSSKCSLSLRKNGLPYHNVLRNNRNNSHKINNSDNIENHFILKSKNDENNKNIETKNGTSQSCHSNSVTVDDKIFGIGFETAFQDYLCETYRKRKLLEEASVATSKETLLLNITKPTISVSFTLNNCKEVDICANKSNLKKIHVENENNNIHVNCEIEPLSSQISSRSSIDENVNDSNLSQSTKRSVAVVKMNIKKKKLTSKENSIEKSQVLFLNTNAIEKFSHVTIHPPNYEIVKKPITSKRKLNNNAKNNCSSRNGSKNIDNLKQHTLDAYFNKDKAKSNTKVFKTLNATDVKTVIDLSDISDVSAQNVNIEMSKDFSVAGDTNKCDIRKSPKKSIKNVSPKYGRTSVSPENISLTKRLDVHVSSKNGTRSASPDIKNSIGSQSPRKSVNSLQFGSPITTKSNNKTSVNGKNIPHYKIVAGTHFAVDAFSYGDIPNVNNYFLTHFHSDHYCGLKKSFNKLLLCSKITADLCKSRLGVNPKCINIIGLNETIRVEGVEVTSMDANHCPGAIMLIFTLQNGKTILHTGDFRASPLMESHPIFWNKDIHTIYLDTTYCNPRYDFPTQEQSLEMALYLLKQKKLDVEKAGKAFSSVLIVCGTYTIGKEKFFLGMSRRVGCSVWACPEKNRVLEIVEDRNFNSASPQSCQLHVVPMRDLTYEKLRSYLDNLGNAFTEVVAFKPSGWENRKNCCFKKDKVTIHGIPYSEHSSFWEMIRFVKFLSPKQVVATVDISSGVKSVQKYFQCPIMNKEDIQSQSKLTDFFSIQNRKQVPAVS